MMTDPIADMLTRLRNAAAVGHHEVNVPASKLKRAVADVLKEAGYISKITDSDRNLVLELAVEKGAPKLTHLKRLSKPGRRTYLPARRLPWVREGLGIAIISTSQGVMSADTARKRRLGGEILLEAY